MQLCELNLDQQTFAEEHHDQVYRFLRSKRLPLNDYYDVVVFGYLRAVRQYCSNTELRRKYSFNTIAWRKMQDDLANHFKKQSRPSRKAVTISLETLLFDSESFTVSEVVSSPDQMMEDLDAKLLWEQITGLLSEDQITALHMKVSGYSDREIAARRQRKINDIKAVFADIQAAVHELCLI
jgi:RNA polymerase sigma-70 factor (ECF subfamily)